eukprot:TRINITY_DN8386_c0_g2_i2.p1 TRINITY_DN8386_c0_g2~~TRINITY_DN8386_c0_g2_i2.p1  ORF type:complete len:2144 (-),score=370.59 TRINITY_DN8386_c0_g2_i2:345-6290(-)
MVAASGSYDYYSVDLIVHRRTSGVHGDTGKSPPGEKGDKSKRGKRHKRNDDVTDRSSSGQGMVSVTRPDAQALSEEMRKRETSRQVIPFEATTTSFKDGSGEIPSVMQSILERHNTFRCMHNVTLLIWSPEYATNAQNSVDSSAFDVLPPPKLLPPTTLDGMRLVGENMGVGDVGPGIVDSWYREVMLTDYGQVNTSNPAAARYTQLVWGNTTHVGCGMKLGVLLCQYGPPGNVAGRYKENINPVQKTRAQCDGKVEVLHEKENPANKGIEIDVESSKLAQIKESAILTAMDAQKAIDGMGMAFASAQKTVLDAVTTHDHARLLNRCHPESSRTWASYCELSRQQREKKAVNNAVLIVNMKSCTITMGLGDTMALSQCVDNSDGDSQANCTVYSRNGLHCESPPIAHAKQMALPPPSTVPLQHVASATPAGIPTAASTPDNEKGIVPRSPQLPPSVTPLSNSQLSFEATIPQPPQVVPAARNSSKEMQSMAVLPPRSPSLASAEADHSTAPQSAKTQSAPSPLATPQNEVSNQSEIDTGREKLDKEQPVFKRLVDVNVSKSTNTVGAEDAEAKRIIEADVLKRHNLYRCMHDVPKLTWNAEIAKNAESWARTTGKHMKHSPTSSRSGIGGFEYIGENIVWGRNMVGAAGVDQWYSEILTTVNQEGAVDDSNETLLSSAGHFSQLVWRETTKIGCGMDGLLLVCQYGPGGNKMGHYKLNVLPKNTKSLKQCEAELNQTVPAKVGKTNHKKKPEHSATRIVHVTPIKARKRRLGGKRKKLDRSESTLLSAKKTAAKKLSTDTMFRAVARQRLVDSVSRPFNASDNDPKVHVKQATAVLATPCVERHRPAHSDVDQLASLRALSVVQQSQAALDRIGQADVVTGKPNDSAEPDATLVEDDSSAPVLTHARVASYPPETASQSAIKPLARAAVLNKAFPMQTTVFGKAPSLSQTRNDMAASKMAALAEALVPTVLAFETLNESEVNRARSFASNLRYSLQACAGVFDTAHEASVSTSDKFFASLLEASVQAASVENIASGQGKGHFSVQSDSGRALGHLASHSRAEIDAGALSVDKPPQLGVARSASLLDLGMSIFEGLAASWRRLSSALFPSKETIRPDGPCDLAGDASIAQAASAQAVVRTHAPPSSLLALSATAERDVAGKKALAKPVTKSKATDDWSKSEVATRLTATLQESTQALAEETKRTSSSGDGEGSADKMVQHAEELAKQATQLASMMYAAAGSKTAQKELEKQGISPQIDTAAPPESHEALQNAEVPASQVAHAAKHEASNQNSSRLSNVSTSSKTLKIPMMAKSSREEWSVEVQTGKHGRVEKRDSAPVKYLSGEQAQTPAEHTLANQDPSQVHYLVVTKIESAPVEHKFAEQNSSPSQHPPAEQGSTQAHRLVASLDPAPTTYQLAGQNPTQAERLPSKQDPTPAERAKPDLSWREKLVSKFDSAPVQHGEAPPTLTKLDQAPAEHPLAKQDPTPAEQTVAKQDPARAEHPVARLAPAPAEYSPAKQVPAPAKQALAKQDQARAEHTPAKPDLAWREKLVSKFDSAPVQHGEAPPTVAKLDQAPAEHPLAKQDPTPAEQTVAKQDSARAEHPVAKLDQAPAEQLPAKQNPTPWEQTLAKQASAEHPTAKQVPPLPEHMLAKRDPTEALRTPLQNDPAQAEHLVAKLDSPQVELQSAEQDPIAAKRSRAKHDPARVDHPVPKPDQAPVERPRSKRDPARAEHLVARLDPAPAEHSPAKQDPAPAEQALAKQDPARAEHTPAKTDSAWRENLVSKFDSAPVQHGEAPPIVPQKLKPPPIVIEGAQGSQRSSVGAAPMNDSIAKQNPVQHDRAESSNAAQKPAQDAQSQVSATKQEAAQDVRAQDFIAKRESANDSMPEGSIAEQRPAPGLRARELSNQDKTVQSNQSENMHVDQSPLQKARMEARVRAEAEQQRASPDASPPENSLQNDEALNIWMDCVQKMVKLRPSTEEHLN